VPLRLADCTDWRNSDVAERLGTIRQLSDFSGQPIASPAGPGHGPTLPEDQAYKLLDGYCKAPFARAFKLYKIYIRAAAFQGLADKYGPK
jgi:hypothetical protein